MKQLIDLFLPIEGLDLSYETIQHLRKFGFIKVYQLFNKEILNNKYNLEIGILPKSSYISNKVYASFDSERLILLIELLEFFKNSILYIPPLSGQSGYETLKLAFQNLPDEKSDWKKIIRDAIIRNYYWIRNAGIKYDKVYHDPARIYVIRYLRGTKKYDFEYNSDYGCLKEFSDWQLNKVIDELIDGGYFFQKLGRYYGNRYPILVLTNKGQKLCSKVTPKEDIIEHDRLVRIYLKKESDRFGPDKGRYFS